MPDRIENKAKKSPSSDYSIETEVRGLVNEIEGRGGLLDDVEVFDPRLIGTSSKSISLTPLDTTGSVKIDEITHEQDSSFHIANLRLQSKAARIGVEGQTLQEDERDLRKIRKA